jgi:mono/diheme cytochrome c family protein
MQTKKQTYFHIFIVLYVIGALAFQLPEVYAQTNSWTAPAYVDTIKNPVSFSGPLMEEAKKIYNTTCWSCHGLDGKGGGPASLQMNTKPADHTSSVVLKQSDGALFWKISVGKGDMQPYSKLLTVKQRWALVNYIRSLAPAKN